MIKRFINAHIVLDDRILLGEVEVTNNIISYVGKNRLNFSTDIACTVYDLQGKILMPGFINTHCHNPMSLFRGMGNDADFFSWWEKYMKPMEEQLNDEDVFYGTLLSACEMLRAGITTTVDLYMFPKAFAKALHSTKMRAFVALGTPDGTPNITQENLKQQHKNINSFNSELIKPIAFAHAPYSCDEADIAEIIKYAVKNNLVFTTHVSETLYEVGESDKKYNMSPIEYLESLGVFDCKCILSHCVHLDKNDIEIISRYDVSVNTNPASNLVLGSGIAPVYAYKQAGINICLGTDGVASNDSLDMFKEMFLVKNLQSGVLNDPAAITCTDALNYATINGAKALNLPNLGLIKKGFLADLIVVDNSLPNMQPAHNIITNLVQSAGVSNVYLTMVNGEVLYENGKFFILDYEKIKSKANNAIKRIKTKLEL